MTEIFNPDGDLVAITLLEISPVGILEEISYPSKKVVKIGFDKLEGKKISKLKKPVLGYFNKAGIGAYKFIREVIAAETDSQANDKTPQNNKREIGVELFKEGDIINVRAKTKGRGFAGGVKRHGWRGQPKTHGSMSHRRIGSAGTSAFPSRIIKGLHMPGHMGNVNRTIKNLKVLKVDKEKNLLFIKGAVPGSNGGIVKIIKKTG